MILVVTRENRSFYICPDGEGHGIVSQYRLTGSARERDKKIEMT